MTTKQVARALVMAVLVTVGHVTVGLAQTIRMVTTNADSGPGSLRQAVADAVAGDTIRFDGTQVVSPISLSSGQIVLDKNLNIEGPGATLLTVRNTAPAGPASRVFSVPAGLTATISGLTISGGSVPFPENGGGILNRGTLTLSRVTVTGNRSGSIGGGIANVGGVLIVAYSTVSSNEAAGGGGLATNSVGTPFPTTTVTHSTVAGNRTTAGLIDNGGGIYHVVGQLRVLDSTISGNASGGNGGGIQASGGLTLINSTLSGNTAWGTGGLRVIGGTTTLQNTIIANNGEDCRSGGVGVVNTAHSLIESDVDCLLGFPGTAINNLTGDPLLGPLQDNGGPTETHALRLGSPAIDAGSDALAMAAGLTTDQRGPGAARVVDGGVDGDVDIGAFEYDARPKFFGAAPITLERGNLGGTVPFVGTAVGAPPLSVGQIPGGTATGLGFVFPVVNANGAVFATQAAVSCTATGGTVWFGVIDGNNLSGVGELQVNVVPASGLACSCLAGSYYNGTSCVAASPGFFVPTDYALSQTACSPGRYQPLAGQTSCLLAQPGNHVPAEASSAQSPCPLGRYQPNAGATSCIDAPPGTFVNVLEAIAPVDCSPGTYQPLLGQTSCLPAEPGTYVADSGAQVATACELGKYQPLAGQTSCRLADPGYYVPYVAAIAQLQCPVGTTSPAGASACTPVLFSFTGFFQPVDNLPTLNVVKAGQAIPVKFALGGNQGLNIFAAGFPASALTTCGSTTADDVEETTTAGSSSLAYDAVSDRYTYTWKTDKAWANTCRTLTVRYRDGTIQQANFQFKK